MAVADLASSRACWRAAYLLTSDDPGEIRQGARLALSLPKSLRAVIMTAIEYYTTDDEKEE